MVIKTFSDLRSVVNNLPIEDFRSFTEDVFLSMYGVWTDAGWAIDPNKDSGADELDEIAQELASMGLEV